MAIQTAKPENAAKRTMIAMFFMKVHRIVGARKRKGQSNLDVRLANHKGYLLNSSLILSEVDSSLFGEAIKSSMSVDELLISFILSDWIFHSVLTPISSSSTLVRKLG